MRVLHSVCRCIIFIALILVCYSPGSSALDKPEGAAGPAQAPTQQRDAQHDWDWDVGTWKIHQKRLLRPLTGSATWVEYQGTDVVRRIWDGHATEAQIESNGPAGHLEIFALRVYDPQAHNWSIYFNNGSTGSLGTPVVGEFKNGRGEFYDQEILNGRDILVRFSVSDITSTSCHFEQAFSPDWGKTWEVNLIVDETLDHKAELAH